MLPVLNCTGEAGCHNVVTQLFSVLYILFIRVRWRLCGSDSVTEPSSVLCAKDVISFASTVYLAFDAVGVAF